ncbi:PPM-type phosphatase domain-containing protein [uncultured Thiomicrorhabdus sp.]
MPADSAAAKDARIAGWTTPLDYSKVNQLLKELNIGPFEVQIQKIELQKHQKSLTEIISIEEMVFVTIVFLFALFLLIKYYGKSKLLDIKLTTFNKGLILFELGVILFLSYELLVLDRLEHALAKSYEQRHQMVNAADELRQSSDDLSRFARSYAVTGNSEFKNRFFHILDIRNGTAPRPQNYNEIYWDLDKETRRQRHPDSENIALNSLFETLPLSPLEREKLQESEANSNTLTKLESSVFAAMEKGQQATAIKLLHSPEYYAAKQQIMLPIDEMLQMLRLRTEGEIAVLHNQVTNHFHFLIGAGILFFIGNIFVYLLLRRKVNQPVAYLTNVIKDFQNGTRDCKFKQFYNDEIGYMIQQFFVMQAIINDANDEVAEQKAFLRTLLDSQEQIIITLHDKNLYQANASFHQFFGTANIEDFHAKYRVSCISDLFSEMVPEEYLTAEKDGQDWIDFMLDNPDISTHKAMILLGEEAYIFAATAARLPTKEKMTSVVFTNITEMETAKQEVDALNQRTQESINYASLIQKALLPSEDILQKHFTDYFAIWQPRDIVGGDIFFVEELDEEHLLLMVIDCTGHGVPGALVTMLVKAIERQLVSTIRRTNEKVSPANLLGIYNKSIKHLLQQNRHDSLSNAGFDGAILYYDKVQNILRFAGANIPLFLHTESELTEIRGDRHSIGYRSSKSDFNFTDHEITINAPLSVYLTTDGYLDQNGGTKGFPFGKRRFKQMINELSDIEMAQQKNEFLQHLHDYQGNEQTNDDLTIVALKIEPNTK